MIVTISSLRQMGLLDKEGRPTRPLYLDPPTSPITTILKHACRVPSATLENGLEFPLTHSTFTVLTGPTK